MKSDLTGKIVINTRTGMRLLVREHRPEHRWAAVVPARKDGKPDRRYYGWSGSDKFLEIPKVEEAN